MFINLFCVCIKGYLMSFFFNFALLDLPKKFPNNYPRIEIIDLATFFEDSSQSQNNFEIKPPLALEMKNSDVFPLQEKSFLAKDNVKSIE